MKNLPTRYNEIARNPPIPEQNKIKYFKVGSKSSISCGFMIFCPIVEICYIHILKLFDTNNQPYILVYFYMNKTG